MNESINILKIRRVLIEVVLEIFEIIINFIPLKIIILMATFDKNETISIMHHNIRISHLIVFLVIFSSLTIMILNKFKSTPGTFIKLRKDEKKQVIEYFSFFIALIILPFNLMVGSFNLIYIFLNKNNLIGKIKIDLSNYFQGFILFYLLFEYYFFDQSSLIAYIIVVAGTRIISVKQKIYNDIKA